MPNLRFSLSCLSLSSSYFVLARGALILSAFVPILLSSLVTSSVGAKCVLAAAIVTAVFFLGGVFLAYNALAVLRSFSIPRIKSPIGLAVIARAAAFFIFAVLTFCSSTA